MRALRCSRFLLLVCLLIGCTSAERLEISLTGEKAERLLQFYFSSYLNQEPFQVGVLEKKQDRFYLDLKVLQEFAPDLAWELHAKAAGNILAPESLQTVIQATYYHARNLPRTLSEFHDQWPIESPQTFEVHGPVTQYLRRISMEKNALHHAVTRFSTHGEKIIYDAGTSIRAEHISEGKVLETTAMIKRDDGFWDFATYDSTGALTSETLPSPRSLATPTKCAGCHLGTKAFEPEKSWPHPAPLPPEGVRKWYTGTQDQEVTDFFREHIRRSDMVLGIYATTYVSDLRRDHRAGVQDSNAAMLLRDLGL